MAMMGFPLPIRPPSSVLCLLNRRVYRDSAPCHVGVQTFHHASIELDRALAPVLQQVERGNDLLRLRHLISGRRERGVTGSDLVGMDQPAGACLRISECPGAGFSFSV